MPGKFRQTVRPGPGVDAGVVLLVGGRVGQPVVGAQIDDLDFGRELGRERSRGAVWQRQEYEVGAGESLRDGVREDEVGERA